MKDSPYFRQAELILRAMPHVVAERCFALKGGTAINLFLRDMLRLSVDIDLAYLPVEEPRETALKNISEALGRIATAIKKAISGSRVQESRAQGSARIAKLIVAAGQTRIKIEPNEVIRGSVFSAEQRELTRSADEMFQLSVTARTLSVADLYGGKLCAALDRQHPRDLFDVMVLLENEGISDEIRKAFVVYLASHDRPMNELLDPTRKDMRQVYETEFVGMTIKAVQYEDLIRARETLIETLKKELTDAEKAFLVSLKEGQPDWGALAIPGVEKLPAIQWKLMNIRKMENKRRVDSLEKLKRKLEL